MCDSASLYNIADTAAHLDQLNRHIRTRIQTTPEITNLHRVEAAYQCD